MSSLVTASLDDLTTRALIKLSLQRQETILTDIAGLQAALAAQQTALENLRPVIQALVDINTRAVGTLEALVAQIAALRADSVTQEQIDAIATSVSAEVAEIQSDSLRISGQNTVLQDELDKVAPLPPPPPPPPTTEG